MPDEKLQFDLVVNFSDYQQSITKIQSATAKANAEMQKSYDKLDTSVAKLTESVKKEKTVTDAAHSSATVAAKEAIALLDKKTEANKKAAAASKTISLAEMKASSITVSSLNKEKEAIIKQGAVRRAAAAELMASSKKRSIASKIAAEKIVAAEKKVAATATMTALKIKNLEERNKKLALQTEKARIQNNKLNTSLTKTTKTSGGLSKTVKTLAGAYLGFAAARKLLRSSLQLGGKILDESGQLETATEKWRIFKGSADEAATTIKDLFEFSNRTPFTFKDVNAAATQLFVLTDGALQGSEAMEQLGDRAAMAKVPMSQLTTWWGRLYAGMQSGKPIGRALTRMQQLGIVSGKLRNKLDGLSKDDMMSGKGWEMFIEGTSKADGMISELAKTIEGKRSTLSGVWDGLFALEGDSLDTTKDSLDNIIKALNDNKGLIQDFFSFSLEVFSASVNGAMSLLKGYMSYVDSARNSLGGAGAGAALNARETKYTGQSNVSLARTSSSLGLQRKAIRAQISSYEKGLIKDRGMETAQSITQKAIKGDPSGWASEADDAIKLGKLYEKLNDVTDERLAVNHVLMLQEKELAKEGSSKATSNGFTGLGLGGGATGKPKSLTSSDPFLEKMFADTGGNPDDYSLLSTNSNYTDSEFKTRKGDNNIYKEDAERRLAIITDGWTRSMTLQEDTDAKMLEATAKFYSDSISIIDSSNSTIIGFHAALTAGDASGVLGGLSSGVGGVSSILGTLGLVDPSGISGILGGVLGIGSTIAGFFGGDDDTESTSSAQDIAATSASARANIVSSGVETVNLSVNFTNYSTYTNDDGIEELFTEKFIPLLKDTANGAFANV